jgi:hypothetical protein
MTTNHRIALTPGDGIGAAVPPPAQLVLEDWAAATASAGPARGGGPGLAESRNQPTRLDDIEDVPGPPRVVSRRPLRTGVDQSLDHRLRPRRDVAFGQQGAEAMGPAGDRHLLLDRDRDAFERPGRRALPRVSGLGGPRDIVGLVEHLLGDRVDLAGLGDPFDQRVQDFHRGQLASPKRPQHLVGR